MKLLKRYLFEAVQLTEEKRETLYYLIYWNLGAVLDEYHPSRAVMTWGGMGK